MGPTGLSKLTHCVLDGSSQSSFIAKALIDKLKLEVVDCQDLVVSAFESQASDSGPHKVVLLHGCFAGQYYYIVLRSNCIIILLLCTLKPKLRSYLTAVFVFCVTLAVTC
jgi:hypothetical protein